MATSPFQNLVSTAAIPQPGFPVTRGGVFKLVREEMIVSALTFNTPLPTFPGASVLVAVVPIAAPTVFTISMPWIFAPRNVLMAVKWIAGGVVNRFALNEGNGEIISFPLYTSAIIPAAGALLEYWMVPTSQHQPSFPALTIPISPLDFPSQAPQDFGTPIAEQSLGVWKLDYSRSPPSLLVGLGL